jgi:fructoselysine 6-phosphate deglycase
MDIQTMISDIKTEIERAGGLKHVFFIGCGGSKAAVYPGFYFLESEATSFGTSTYTSNEFVHSPPKLLDNRCICICCSLNATPETVKALKTAKGKGAAVIGLTGNINTDLAKASDRVLIYSNGDNQVYSESNQANVLKLSAEIINQFEGYRHYTAIMEAFNQIDGLVERAKRDIRPIADEWAEESKDNSITYILASGPNWGAAYSMCHCHLMEMQWKHAVAINSGEYFHGPFETTDMELPLVLFIAEGRTRALDERCLNFLQQYAKHYLIIDSRNLGIGEISHTVAEFFNPLLTVPVERYIVGRMAEVRSHSMEQRRYMWKVEY